MRNAESKSLEKKIAAKKPGNTAPKKKPQMVSITLDEVIDRGLTKDQIARLDREELPGRGGSGDGIRLYEHPEHPLYRALSKPVTIRLPLPDLRMSRLLAAAADLPYQTYIKSVLHEALMERFAKSGLNKTR